MRFYQDLKLSIKVGLVGGLVVLIIIGSLMGVNVKQLYNVTLENGEYKAKEAAQAFQVETQTEMIAIQSMLYNVSFNLLFARDARTLSRDDVVGALYTRLQDYTEYSGIFNVWEPNAFDNEDSSRANKAEFEDKTGQYSPYLIRSGDQIVMGPLSKYEPDAMSGWYAEMKKTKSVYIREPSEFKMEGETVLLTSIIYPILDNSGEFVGAVGVNLSLGDIQGKAEKAKLSGEFEGFVSLISEKGSYVANGDDSSKLATAYGNTAATQQIWHDVKTGLRKVYSTDANGNQVIRMFQPIDFGVAGTTWYAESVIDKASVLVSFWNVVKVSITIAIVSLILLGALLYLSLRRLIIRPLYEMNEVLGLMTQGDISHNIEVKGEDEFGLMARQFNVMVGSLRNIVQLVSDLSMNVSATSEELIASAEQTSLAAETISEAIGDVAIGAQAQDVSTREAVQSMNQMTLGIRRIAESSVAVSSSVQDVTVHTEKGNNTIQEAVQQMGMVRDTVNQSALAIHRLTERSAEINSIVSIIRGISTQTQMLALNAGIEAARVGSEGKGFAVVASEIRALAEQTKTSAEQVASLIDEIQQDTDKAMAAMNLGTSEVEKGVQNVTEGGELFASIMAEMEEVRRRVKEVSTSSKHILASSQQVTYTMEHLADTAKVATAGSESVAAASEQQLASMQEITTSSEALGSSVQELLNRLSIFKSGRK